MTTISKNANKYICTSTSIYSFSQAYLQIRNAIKTLYLHPRSTKHLKTCMQFVCFHEKYKIVWLKLRISLHSILNKFFATRTDLTFELKMFGH